VFSVGRVSLVKCVYVIVTGPVRKPWCSRVVTVSYCRLFGLPGRCGINTVVCVACMERPLSLPYGPYTRDGIGAMSTEVGTGDAQVWYPYERSKVPTLMR